MAPKAFPGGRSFNMCWFAAPAGKVRASTGCGAPAGDQFVGSAQLELVAPVHVRVIAKSEGDATRQIATTVAPEKRFIREDSLGSGRTAIIRSGVSIRCK